MAHSDDIDDTKVGTKQMEETNPIGGKYLTWAAASLLAAQYILQPQGMWREMGSLSCVDFVEFSSEISLCWAAVKNARFRNLRVCETAGKVRVS